MTGQLDRIRELEKLFSSEENTISEKIVVVTSGKGGTGKSFFAANFSYQYSKSYRVLLIDADFNLSNLHLLLNANPQKTLNAFFESNAVFNEIITKYNSNLDIIFGDAGSLSLDKPSFNQINRLFKEINNISSEYDLIVFDLGAGISDENLHVLSKAKTKIIITNPEPTALMDAYVIIKLLKNNKTEDGVYIAINRCREESDGAQAFQNLKAAVDHFLKTKIKFLTEIPESAEVRKSIIDQKLFAEISQSNKVISSINTSVSKISKIHQVFNINQLDIKDSSISFKNSF
ncbi:MAG: P-loop NTPase [Ignavibacteriales bacterium]|nr:P-loop NTPase [Ignavibacteriales bacterium]